MDKRKESWESGLVRPAGYGNADSCPPQPQIAVLQGAAWEVLL